MYNLEYFERMLRLNSATAEDICHKRWAFLSKYCEPIALKEGKAKVLDYGSGVGWFRAFRPRWCDVWSYDIAQYPQTGVKLQLYDCVCFWDVLEHIPDFTEIEPVLALSSYVALTFPVKPKEKSYWEWKHTKPREHLHLLSEESIIALFAKYGFTPVTMSYDIECPPREDILTALFGRTQ